MRSSPAYLTVLCPHAIWTPQGYQSTKIFNRELWLWLAHVTAHCDRRSTAVGQLLTARNMLVAVSACRWPPTHQMHVSNTYQHVQGPRALATGVGCSFAGRQHFTPTNGIAEHAFVWQTCNVVTVQPPAAPSSPTSGVTQSEHTSPPEESVRASAVSIQKLVRGRACRACRGPGCWWACRAHPRPSAASESRTFRPPPY